jgi:protein-L-isoaspartate(D-aspartate) O-methyltransferase
MDAVTKYQRQLLDQARQIYNQTPISEPTAHAFLATPRHLFVRRYRERASTEWFHVDEGNLHEHAATLYADRPLILFGDDDDNVPSTISQPSFVLRMLDLLQVRPGQSVLELGAGSAWNAALLGQLVGSAGTVHSLEILPELAQHAAATIARLGITNVHILHGDGGDGYAAGAPYDRIIFTAGTYDLPREFYTQIKEGGLLLAVIKNAGGGDHLFVLQRVGDHFRSLDSMPCGFVQLTGKYKNDALDAVLIETSPQWAELQRREMARRPFWWGGKGSEWFQWQTAGIRSFLGITEPMFRAYKTARREPGGLEEQYFGLWDEQQTSLVLAKQDELISYGTMAATDRLLQVVHTWVDLGMPTAASFDLQVYRSDRPVTTRENQWTVTRTESQFRWSLDT